MARRITVNFTDGTSHVYENAPDEITPDAIAARVAQEFAGKTIKSLDGGRTPPGQIPKSTAITAPGAVSQEAPSARTFSEKAFAYGVDLPMSLAAGTVGSLASPIIRLGATLMSPEKLGTPGADAAGQRAAAAFEQGLYRPQTLQAQNALEVVGKVAEPLVGVLPTRLGPQGAVRQAVRAGTDFVAPPAAAALTQAQQRIVATMPKREPQQPGMVGMGAASTEAGRQRMEMAQSLPEPVPLLKGMAEREQPGIRAQELDISKTYPEGPGGQLLKRQAEINRAILGNFDAFSEMTGSQQYGPNALRPVGKVVDKALVDYAQKAWDNVNAAYEQARQAGHMADPVPYQPLVDFIDSQGPTVRSKLAPILDAVAEQVRRNDPDGTGAISVNGMEEIRQLVNKLAQPGTPNEKFAVDLKRVIDQATENAGGDLYKRARQLRFQYGKEFETVGAVDKLLSTTKSGDRRVAFEDIWNHSIMGGSLDDTMAIGRLLKRAGPEGQQAWKELQGQTVAQLKEAVTRNIQTDMQGNRVPSVAKFDAMVRELDSSGKLDYIFGKKGAEQIRALRDTTATALTEVPGVNNYSNTASALVRNLERIQKSVSGLPGVRNVAEFAAEQARMRELMKAVDESIGYVDFYNQPRQ